MYRRLLVLFHRGANGRFEPFLASRCVADRPGNCTELLQHFTLKKRRGVFYAESLEGTFGEVAQQLTRFVVEIVE